MSATRVLSVDFGDLEAKLWGGVWAPEGATEALTHLAATGTSPEAVSATLHGKDPDRPWELAGPGIGLTITPIETPPGAIAPIAPIAPSLGQLCRVKGSVSAGGAVDCVGVRSIHELTQDDYESLRAVAGWFGAEDGFAVTALRPKRARSHASDQLTGIVFESGTSLAVTEPRLSSTYASDGRPIRAGLELWFKVQEGEEEKEFLRRASGEALGDALVADVPGNGFEIRTELFRWRARGLEGAGVYRLISRR